MPGHSSSLRLSHSCTRLTQHLSLADLGTKLEHANQTDTQLTLQELSRHNREKDNDKDNQLILSLSKWRGSCYPKSLSLNTKTSPPQSPLNFPLDQETDLSGLKLKAWKIIKLPFSVTKSHNKIMFPHHPPEGENLRPNYSKLSPWASEGRSTECLTKHQ